MKTLAVLTAVLLCPFWCLLIVRIAGQALALKKGRIYRSDRVSDEYYRGNIAVEYTDENGERHRHTFHTFRFIRSYDRYAPLTQTDIYVYKRFASLGKQTIKGDAVTLVMLFIIPAVMVCVGSIEEIAGWFG